MGTLLSILGTIGIISSGAGTAATATSKVKNVDLIMEDVILNPTVTMNMDLLKGIINQLIFDLKNGSEEAEKVIESISDYINNSLPELMNENEIMSFFSQNLMETLPTEAAVEGGILAGSLGTAAETLGDGSGNWCCGLW